MPTTGSQSGIHRSPFDQKGFDIDLVRYWQDIRDHETSGFELYQTLVNHAKPTQLEIGIGNTCGLECQHCYLSYPSGAMKQKLTSLEILRAAATTLVETLGTRLICIADRDALTPNRSIPYFQHLAELRQRHPDLKFGGVTNGLAMPQFVHELAQIKLDYLDISIDGTQYEHDQIRGQGQFDRVLANLRLALTHQVAERVIVATTLSRLNDDATIQLIARLIQQEGVRWFDVSPLMNEKLMDGKMSQHHLQPSDMVKFLDSLVRILKPMQVVQPVTILVEIPTYSAAFLPSLVTEGWLIPEKLRQDSYGRLYQDIPVNQGIMLTLRPELIPDYWRQSVRITADGYVVSGCEALTQRDYEKFAVGNIQTESIATIYARAIAPESVLHQMLLDKYPNYMLGGRLPQPCCV